jgi:hypothetical protein
MAPSVGIFQMKMIEACVSNARSMLHINVKNPFHLQLLMHELLESKKSLGFQFTGGIDDNFISPSDKSISIDDNDPDFVSVFGTPVSVLVAYMFAVSPSSPSGIETESLIQCKYSILDIHIIIVLLH